MVNLVIVRHGQTEYNKNKIMMGQNSTPLDSEGIEQAKKLGKELSNKFKFRKIYSSDLLRAVQTTNEIMKHFPYQSVQYINELRERNIGSKFHGKPYGKFDDFIKLESGEIDLNKKTKDGESSVEFYNRVKNVTEMLLESCSAFDTQDNVLLVSHGGTIRLMLAYLFFEKNNSQTHLYNYFPADVYNCSITEIFYNKKVILKYVNYHQYLCTQ